METERAEVDALLNEHLGNRPETTSNEFPRLLAECNQKIARLEHEARVEIESKRGEINNRLYATKAELNKVQYEKTSEMSKISRLSAEKDEKAGLLAAAGKEWQKQNIEAYKDEIETVCPVCGQDLPVFKVQEAQENAIKAFNERKLKRLAEIENDGKRLKERIDSIKSEIENANARIQSLEQEERELIEKIDANETIKKMNESLLYVNKQLEESVVTDTLTGIYNREGYITKVREIEESEEIKDCIVLYFDLDNFKYYNDTFGHDVGDLVLVQLAKILQFLAEDNGIPIRYGGDEFLLIVPEITIEQAEAIAKEFYNILKQREYFIPKIEQVLKKKVDIPEEKQISSSIGIARTDYKAGRNIEKTVSYADASLYDVKKSKKKAARSTRR